MRSEQQMLDIITSTARDDDSIRAAMLNGSRANPHAPRDFFQDFDVVYFVTDVVAFRCNYEWIKRFGELMILQEPEEMADPPPGGTGQAVYLMQFTDGNRIDLGLYPLSAVTSQIDDSLTIVLLDKDGLLEGVPPASERDYLPKPPTAKAFADCCNEFWWVSPYVAKGLWRREIINAKYFQEVVREELDKMVRWYIGVRTGFAVNPGKYGKYWERYLEPELWQMVLQTYSEASYDGTWDALFAMGGLFRLIARRVAEKMGFDYPEGDDTRVSAHLRHVRELPRDAAEMY